MGALVSRILIMVAVLVAPLNMVGHAQAMTPAASPDAHNAAIGHHGSAPKASESEAAVAPDHCAGGADERPGDRRALAFDCAIACAALPAMPSPIAEIARIPAPLDPPALLSAPPGLHPEAATPPPRFS